MSQNFSLHENYRDEESIEGGTDRAFGCTVGSILAVIGVAKLSVAGALSPAAGVLLGAGAMLLLLGIIAPSRLSPLNRIWLRLGALIAKVVNPIVLALLFFFVVTPMALVVRMAGKRPLRLTPDRTASSYWIYRNVPQSEASSMRRQF
jgi:large-conductance mechanosensitive channel